MDNQFTSRLLSQDVTTDSLEILELKTIRTKEDPQSNDEQVKKLEKEYEYFSKKNEYFHADPKT